MYSLYIEIYLQFTEYNKITKLFYVVALMVYDTMYVHSCP